MFWLCASFFCSPFRVGSILTDTSLRSLWQFAHPPQWYQTTGRSMPLSAIREPFDKTKDGASGLVARGMPAPIYSVHFVRTGPSTRLRTGFFQHSQSTKDWPPSPSLFLKISDWGVLHRGCRARASTLCRAQHRRLQPHFPRRSCRQSDIHLR